MTTTISTITHSPFLTERHGKRQRWPVALLAAIAGIAHIPVTAPHLIEAPYMGILFIALTVSCLALSAIVLVRDSGGVYLAVAVICGLAVIGYAATRLIPFPLLGDDVGNWLEPLGIVSVTTETLACAFAVAALTTLRSTRERASFHPAA